MYIQSLCVPYVKYLMQAIEILSHIAVWLFWIERVFVAPTYTCIMTAGNACVLKPSEVSVATSNLVKELIPQYLDKVDTCIVGSPSN